MKRLLALLFIAATAGAAESALQVSAVPFEPAAVHFFQPSDKFAHPREIEAPHFLHPSDGLRAGALMPAEVVVLVQLDGSGRAKVLKVLSSTHEMFTKSAVAALEKAKWDGAGEQWFYYRVRYALDE